MTWTHERDRRPRFHLAVAVDDLEAARNFYGKVLGCREGRSDETWIDFELFGHQLVTHKVVTSRRAASNPVDGDDVPVPHFGVILSLEEFHELAAQLHAAHAPFAIAPHVRFLGEAGEQWTMFLLDPTSNALEFKAFADDAQVFAR